MLERLILKRIQFHNTLPCNLNPFQSAYRRYFSTKSALLLALDNIFHANDTGSSIVLIALDLSAAFDTIEHSIVLNRLQSALVLYGLALAWFQSYLSDRRQPVCSHWPLQITRDFMLYGCSTVICAWSHTFLFIHLTYCSHCQLIRSNAAAACRRHTTLRRYF